MRVRQEARAQEERPTRTKTMSQDEGRRALVEEDEGYSNVHPDHPVHEDYPDNFDPQDGMDHQDGGWIQG